MESKFKYPAISEKIAKENTKTSCTGDMQNVSFDEGSRDNEELLLKHFLKKKSEYQVLFFNSVSLKVVKKETAEILRLVLHL